MDWTNDIKPGEFLIIECYRKIDPTTYTDIFDDIYLKRYGPRSLKNSGVQTFLNSMVLVQCWVV